MSFSSIDNPRNDRHDEIQKIVTQGIEDRSPLDQASFEQTDRFKQTEEKTKKVFSNCCERQTFFLLSSLAISLLTSLNSTFIIVVIFDSTNLLRKILSIAIPIIIFSSVFCSLSAGYEVYNVMRGYEEENRRYEEDMKKNEVIKGYRQDIKKPKTILKILAAVLHFFRFFIPSFLATCLTSSLLSVGSIFLLKKLDPAIQCLAIGISIFAGSFLLNFTQQNIFYMIGESCKKRSDLKRKDLIRDL